MDWQEQLTMCIEASSLDQGGRSPCSGCHSRLPQRHAPMTQSLAAPRKESFPANGSVSHSTQRLSSRRSRTLSKGLSWQQVHRYCFVLQNAIALWLRKDFCSDCSLTILTGTNTRGNWEPGCSATFKSTALALQNLRVDPRNTFPLWEVMGDWGEKCGP